MKISCHFENFHVHIKIYINIKIINKITLASGIQCSILLQLYFSENRKVTSKLVSVNMNEIKGQLPFQRHFMQKPYSSTTVI